MSLSAHEDFIEIQGFPKYFVSSDGEVYSAKRCKILKPVLQKNGYLHVTLCNGLKKQISVHTLVASTFLQPRPLNAVINHKNGEKNDNRACNLEWVTQRENVNHAYHSGLREIDEAHRARCAELGRAKRSYSQNHVQEIKDNYTGKRGEITALSKKLGISRHAISGIIRGQL